MLKVDCLWGPSLEAAGEPGLAGPWSVAFETLRHFKAGQKETYDGISVNADPVTITFITTTVWSCAHNACPPDLGSCLACGNDWA